jgi:CBS domain-containing protein
MRVRDVMQTHVSTIVEEDSLGHAQQMMQWGDIRHLPVVRTSDKRVTGMLSERDILRAYRTHPQQPELLTMPVRDFMVTPVEHIHPNAELADAAADMTTKELGCLPVIELGELVGLVTVGDVLGALAQYPADYRRRAALRKDSAVVASIMYPEPIAVHADDQLLTAAASMARIGVRHACVVDADGCIVGIVSDRDVRRAFGDPRRALAPEHLPVRTRNVRVGQVMTRDPRTVDQDAPIDAALAELLNARVGALPVVDANDRLRGIVSYIDVLKYFDELTHRKDL